MRFIKRKLDSKNIKRTELLNCKEIYLKNLVINIEKRSERKREESQNTSSSSSTT